LKEEGVSEIFLCIRTDKHSKTASGEPSVYSIQWKLPAAFFPFSHLNFFPQSGRAQAQRQLHTASSLAWNAGQGNLVRAHHIDTQIFYRTVCIHKTVFGGGSVLSHVFIIRRDWKARCEYTKCKRLIECM
jgi:hypothetical protein